MMKKINVMRLFASVILCLVAFSGFGQDFPKEGQAPYGFIMNKGQVVDQHGALNNGVKFMLLRPGLNVQIRADGFSYDTYTTEFESAPVKRGLKHLPSDAIVRYHRVDITFPGANPAPEIVANGKSNDAINYISERHITANHYSGILYKNLYPGIDLKLYTNDKGAFEYDFVIHPGADPGAIKLDFAGQDDIYAAGGKALALRLRQGELREQIPASYLEASRKDIDVKFRLNGNRASFDVPEYDMSQTLIIDPQPNLLWGTYYGGSLEDAIQAVTTDASNNVYVGGYSYSSNGSNIIATSGTYQTALSTGPDGFIAVFNSSGVRQMGTYYGAAGADYILGILVNSTGDIFVAGHTTSSSGMTTSGVFQNSFAGGVDAFVAKFTSAGARTWATYFGGGGTGEDKAYDMFFDASNNPVIVGSTQGTSPLSMTTGQTTYGGGTSDAFIASFATATGLRNFSSYFGGSGTDVAFKAMRDGSGNIFMTGATNSTNVGLATVHQTTIGGSFDGFIAKFNSTGVKTWMSYYGGSNDDEAFSIDVVPGTGEAYICGYTYSSSGIATAGAHRTTFNTSSFEDAFIAKFNTSGARQWGTYWGGDNDDELWGISELSGTIFITGYTYSTTGIATAGSHQTSHQGGEDAVLARFDVNGVQQWATYFGGPDNEEALRNTIDAAGNFIATGYTSSSAGIFLGGHQSSFGGGTADGFIAKFENGSALASEPTAQPTAFSATPAATSIAISFTAAAPAPGGGYIALRGTSVPNTDPVDGTSYTVGANLGNAVVVFAGSGTSFNDTGLTASTTYNYKIYSFNGSSGTINYLVTSPLTGSSTTTTSLATEPTTSPSGFNATPSTTSISVAFTAATGTPAGYIALRGTAVPNTDPVDGTDYVAGGTLGNAQVVFVGSTLSFNDTGLTPATTYHYRIYSYNGSGTTINYRQTSPLAGSSTTTSLATEPTASPTGFVATPASTSISVSFTAATGSPAGYIALRGTATPDTDPVDGTAYLAGGTLGNAQIVFVGSTLSFNDTGLTSGTTYSYKIYSYNGSGTAINYRQTSPLTGTSTTTGITSEPADQPSFFTSVPSTNSIQVYYQAAASAPSGYIALRGTAVPNTDPVDGTAYTAGATLGNATVAFVGTATTFNNTSLTASTTYNFKIYSFNGSGTSINYRQVSPLQGTATTLSGAAITEPTAQPTAFTHTPSSTSILVSFTPPATAPHGYIAVRGTAVPTTDPVDFTTYSLGAALGNGFVVYFGSSPTFNDTGLTAGTTYNYKIYSYNGSGTATNYKTASPGPLQGSSTTTSPTAEPTASPTAFTATPGSTSISVSFTAATGTVAGYIALRATASPNLDPVDGFTYSLSATHGNAQVVHVGSGVSFEDTGLSSSTTYQYKIYSYNGSGPAINYRQTSPLTGGSTTTAPGPAAEPTAQPTGFTVSNQTSTGMTISFTAAGGSPVPSSYIAIRASGSSPTFVPADGATYTVGSTVSSGNVVAYFGASTTFEDSGLSASTTYFYRIYSANGSGTSINYLTSVTGLGGSGSTTASPTVPGAFSKVTSPTSLDLLSVRFLDASNVLATGEDGTMIRSTNGGTSWSTVTVPTSVSLWNIVSRSSTEAFAVGNSGTIIRTTNGGSSWSLVTNPATNHLYAAYFVPSTLVGYIVGAAGYVQKTEDGGTTWTALTNAASFTGSYYNTVYFKDVYEGFIAGPDGVIKTINGGVSWTAISTEAILWLSFPSNTIGFGFGSNGTIIKTTDGGSNWTAQSSGVDVNLWNAYFIDTSTGFAVGEEGVVLKTTNGGTTWTTALDAADSETTLYSIHFGSITNGVVVGAFGFIGKAITEPAALTITPNYNTEINANGAVSVGFTVPSADASRITRAELHVIAITDEAKGLVKTVTQVPSSGSGVYTTSITHGGTERIGYKYFFVINYDAEFNRSATTPDGYAYLVYDGTNMLTLVGLRSGNLEKDYQLISVPVELTTPAVASVFDEYGPYDRAVWRLYKVNGGMTSTTNVEMPVGPLEVGKGYWLITTRNTNVGLGKGKAVSVKASDPYTFTLSAGYSLIGNPYNFDVPWTAGTAVGELKYWTGAGWQASNKLEPFKAYFVRVNTAGNYDIPLAGSFTGGRSKGFQFEQNEMSWLLDIGIVKGEYRNELGRIGMHPNATFGIDAVDELVFPMPEFCRVPSLSIDRPEAGSFLEKDIVPPGANQTWEFTLRDEDGTGPVTMTWNRELIAATGRELYLFDEEQLLLIDMLTTDQHRTSTNTRLKIITGDMAFVKSEVKFGSSRIGNVYPNPAAGGFFVPVAMRNAGQVQVRIFDMQGREVASQLHYAGEGMQNISVSGLPEGMSGLYVVATESLDSGRKVQKVIFK